ncbi:MAG: hypothetical protein RLZZ290_498 [Pseudomonadota bacterium]|jgi:hypothetical protein
MIEQPSNASERTVSTRALLTRGFWFYFEHNGHRIAVHNSAWTGRERVFVDDELVATKLSFRMRSRLHFSIDGLPLCAEIRVVDLWKRPRVECLLFDGDRMLAHERLAYSQSGRSGQPYAFLIGALMGGAGVLVGYAVGKLFSGGV